MHGSGFKKRRTRHAKLCPRLAWWRSAAGIAKVIGAVAAAATAMSTATISVVSALRSRVDHESIHAPVPVERPPCRGDAVSGKVERERVVAHQDDAKLECSAR